MLRLFSNFWIISFFYNSSPKYSSLHPLLVNTTIPFSLHNCIQKSFHLNSFYGITFSRDRRNKIMVFTRYWNALKCIHSPLRLPTPLLTSVVVGCHLLRGMRNSDKHTSEAEYESRRRPSNGWNVLKCQLIPFVWKPVKQIKHEDQIQFH